jgi:hypothetical protein
MKKGGSGKGNWGSFKDEVDEGSYYNGPQIVSTKVQVILGRCNVCIKI